MDKRTRLSDRSNRLTHGSHLTDNNARLNLFEFALFGAILHCLKESLTVYFDFMFHKQHL